MTKDNLTDAELVERVAREVTGRDAKFLVDAVLLGCECGYKKWDPLTDANDLQMVLDNFDEWYIEKSDGQYFCELGADVDNASTSDTLPRAVLEAALMARIEK